MAWSPRLTVLEFGSLLSYTPRPESNDASKLELMKTSRNLMSFLKTNRILSQKFPSGIIQLSTTEYIAQLLKDRLSRLPFSNYFQGHTILVPTPRSSLTKTGGLWVPEDLAIAISNRGLAWGVDRSLERIKPVSKSAWSAPGERPSPFTHYDSLAAQSNFNNATDIVLIDDVITRGSTLLGAANRLLTVFPNAQIRAFAAMRTVSNADEFKHWIDPIVGRITLRSDGTITRRP